MTNSIHIATGLGQVQGMGPGAMGPNTFYRNVRTDPKQEKEQGSIVSCCAIRISI